MRAATWRAKLEPGLVASGGLLSGVASYGGAGWVLLCPILVYHQLQPGLLGVDGWTM